MTTNSFNENSRNVRNSRCSSDSHKGAEICCISQQTSLPRLARFSTIWRNTQLLASPLGPRTRRHMVCESHWALHSWMRHVELNNARTGENDWRNKRPVYVCVQRESILNKVCASQCRPAGAMTSPRGQWESFLMSFHNPGYQNLILSSESSPSHLSQAFSLRLLTTSELIVPCVCANSPRKLEVPWKEICLINF